MSLRIGIALAHQTLVVAARVAWHPFAPGPRCRGRSGVRTGHPPLGALLGQQGGRRKGRRPPQRRLRGCASVGLTCKGPRATFSRVSVYTPICETACHAMTHESDHSASSSNQVVPNPCAYQQICMSASVMSGRIARHCGDSALLTVCCSGAAAGERLRRSRSARCGAF